MVTIGYSYLRFGCKARSACHFSNARARIAGSRNRASESSSQFEVPVVLFLLAIPRCYVICSIAFLLVFGYLVLLSAAVVAV